MLTLLRNQRGYLYTSAPTGAPSPSSPLPRSFRLIHLAAPFFWKIIFGITVSKCLSTAESDSLRLVNPAFFQAPTHLGVVPSENMCSVESQSANGKGERRTGPDGGGGSCPVMKPNRALPVIWQDLLRLAGT